ncbi:MAG: hypothetical protein AAF715_24355 [Myxococcota bacterium]
MEPRPGAKQRNAAGMVVMAVATTGCFTGDDIQQPSPDAFYFPTALVASSGGTTLYVANSDFDLRFSGGSIFAMDLRALRGAVGPIAERIAEGDDVVAACAAAGLSVNPDPWLNPGPCDAFPGPPFVANSVFVGAFASALSLTHNPDGAGARLFAPVRGDPSVTYLDVEDDRGAAAADPASFRLDCQVDEAGFCDVRHRLGQDRDRTLRGVQLPSDPIGIAATADGGALVVAHQTEQAASLVVNDWSSVPELTFFVGGLPNGPTELAAIPEPGFVAGSEALTYQSGFTLTFRGASTLDLLRFVPDSGAVPPRPFVTRAQTFPLATNASAFDSRGIAIVDGPRRRCEATCSSAADPQPCLEQCAENVPLRLYMANRSPAQLLVGRMNTVINRDGAAASSVRDEVFFFDTIPLNFGPNRVRVGQVLDEQGTPVDRVFAMCFDSRSIFVIDPETERVETIVRTGRGPQDLAFDQGQGPDGEPFAFAYVAHFTDSYLGVIDLDQRRPNTYGAIFANVGAPQPPVESR